VCWEWRDGGQGRGGGEGGAKRDVWNQPVSGLLVFAIGSHVITGTTLRRPPPRSLPVPPSPPVKSKLSLVVRMTCAQSPLTRAFSPDSCQPSSTWCRTASLKRSCDRSHE